MRSTPRARATVYLDHQASTPLDPRVLAAMAPWWSRAGNPHSSHAAGLAARDAVAEAKQHVAAILGGSPEGVVFTSGATEAANLAIRSFLLRSGDRCLTSAVEHACVRETLADLVGHGVATTVVGVSSDGVVDLERLGDEIDREPSLVTVMAVNNEIGTVQPFADIGRLCSSAGVRFHTDATQAVGKVPIDVGRDGIDLASFSAHKLYGPQGIGALYCRPDLRPRLRPLVTGGGQEGGARAGSVPVALAVGFGSACALALAEMEEETIRLAAMRDAFLGLLCEAGTRAEVNGRLVDRVPGNLSLTFQEIDADALLARLPDLCMSTGSACSSGAVTTSHVLTAIGLSEAQIAGAVRVGFGRCTTADEVAFAAREISREVVALRKAARGAATRRSRSTGEIPRLLSEKVGSTPSYADRTAP